MIKKEIKKQDDLKHILDSQRSEALVAQKAIDNMHKEINELTSLKEATEKQWDEAISAMSKRDKVLQAIENTKLKLSTENLEMKNVIRVLKLERDETTKKLSDKETYCQQMEETLASMKESLKHHREQHHQDKNSLNQAQANEAHYEQELKQLKQRDKVG